jgi:hypothetical protein
VLVKLPVACIGQGKGCQEYQKNKSLTPHIKKAARRRPFLSPKKYY